MRTLFNYAKTLHSTTHNSHTGKTMKDKSPAVEHGVRSVAQKFCPQQVITPLKVSTEMFLDKRFFDTGNVLYDITTFTPRYVQVEFDSERDRTFFALIFSEYIL